MAEDFLEEQLKRIRELTEQVSRVRRSYEVRNRSSEGNRRAHDKLPRPRKHTARDTSRRRGR